MASCSRNSILVDILSVQRCSVFLQIWFTILWNPFPLHNSEKLRSSNITNTVFAPLFAVVLFAFVFSWTGPQVTSYLTNQVLPVTNWNQVWHSGTGGSKSLSGTRMDSESRWWIKPWCSSRKRLCCHQRTSFHRTGQFGTGFRSLDRNNL